jgi:hypothetical protein
VVSLFFVNKAGLLGAQNSVNDKGGALAIFSHKNQSFIDESRAARISFSYSLVILIQHRVTVLDLPSSTAVRRLHRIMP